jgi:fructokinase
MIVGLGEILWDVFSEGPRFGGAPANFACHASALGAQALMVSAVGRDVLGDQAISQLQRHGVDARYVQRLPNYSTGQVQVRLDDAGQPHYEFGRDEAWDHIQWSDDLEQLAQRSAAVCFGTLAQRSATSRHTVQRFVAASRPDVLRIFDINLRPPSDVATIEPCLALANVLKLNDEELRLLARRVDAAGDPAAQVARVAERFDLQVVAVTFGSRGALLYRGGEFSRYQGDEVVVQDTVGAGDSFTAALTLGLLRGLSLDTINQHACQVAAYVCTQPGATPHLPDHLRR